MTSRERVRAALNFQPVDRAPLDVNLTLSAFEKLRTLLGVCPDDRPKPNTAMEILPPPELLTALGIDCLSAKFRGRPQLDGDLPETMRDAWGVEYALVRQQEGRYYETVSHPLAGAGRSDLDGYAWPAADFGEKAESLHKQTEDDFRNTDLALIGRFGAPILEVASKLLGLQEWLTRVMTDRDFITALLDRIEPIATACDLAAIDAAGKRLSIMKVSGEDLGTQRSLLYPPEIISEVFLPVLRRRWDAAHTALRRVGSEAKVMLHSCGAVRSLIPDLIDAGIEALDPVQPLADGMSPDELHAEFAGRMVFHGGIDVQELLPHATPDEVRRETRRVVDEFRGLRGGLIVAPSHTVQADTPPENIVAMADAVRS